MGRAFARTGAHFFRATRLKLAFAALALGCPITAEAQSADPVPPDMRVLSPGKVDMVTGRYGNDVTDLSVGPAGDSLDIVRVEDPRPNKLWTSNWHFLLRQRPADGGYDYSIENSAVGKTWYNAFGSTLFQERSLSPDAVADLDLLGSGTGQYFQYTGTDGTIIRFEPGTDDVWAQSLTRPDGLAIQFQYDSGGTDGAKRLRRVYDNRGYILILEYSIAGDSDKISKVCAINAAITTPPSTNVCPAAARDVTYTYSGDRIASVTDAAGKVSTIAVTFDANGKLVSEAYKKPGMSQAWLTMTYDVSDGGIKMGRVVTSQSFAVGADYDYIYFAYGTDYPNVEGRGIGWTEASGLDNGSLVWDVIQINPQQHPAVTPMPVTVTAAGTTVNYTLNPQWTKIETKQLPSGLLTRYSYDANSLGNISEVRSEAPSGIPDPDIATDYTYDTALVGGVLQCVSSVTCHKVRSKTDPRGNTTDYTYSQVHGGMLTETEAAPAAGGIRPQKRYSYAQMYARYRNSAGTVVQAPTPIWKLTQISECRTTASCANGADEVRTVFTYPSGTGAYNLIPTSKTVRSGDNSISATTAWTYDSNGDKLTEDGPLSGTEDTTRTRYDVMRRIIGVVGPDPDGAGPLKNGAVRKTYDDAGRLTMVERGTVNSQSDTDWAAFVPLERETNSYDLQDRLIKMVTSGNGGSGWVDANVSQMTYDAIGRVICKAIRMDPAQWASQSNACVPQTNGPNGPDRITRYSYNSKGLITKKEVAYGTSIAAAEVTNTWTTDGKLASVTDGEGNTTTYEYDGHDRLVKTRYPVPSKGAGTSSTTDYEQLTLDPASNVTARRLRDGQSIAFTYDNLNRVMLKDLPGSDPDVSYAYSNLDQLTSVSQPGYGLIYTYDALGRQLTEAGPLGTISSQWDVAGRRTRITHPDGDYFTTSYDLLGRADIARWWAPASGNVQFMDINYDSLGRRTTVNRASSWTSYGYDNVSRLQTQSEDFIGSSNDLTMSGFGYNPANQVTGNTRSNDLYAWTGSVTVNRGYNANGLNQYNSAGVVTFTYDARGNLTSDGSVTFGYDSENHLISVSGAKNATVTYDPVGRLASITNGGAITRFLYDGDELIAEYDGATGAMLRRYYFGPGVDEPVLADEGGALDCSGTRVLHGDQQGSIIALADCWGTLATINTYDEYGIPGSGNSGRFQYTGQMWLPELGLYHYKARAYSPTLGRFLQTDPSGYEDGPNWYAYVGNDPTNNSDPSGQRIRLYGSQSDQQLLKQAIIAVGRASPILRQRILTLIASKFSHKIYFSDVIRNDGKAAITNPSIGGPLAKGGSGTKVHIDYFYRSGVDSSGRDLKTMIAHELAGHAYDDDQGIRNPSEDPATGTRIEEENAMAAENNFNRAVGRDLSNAYGDEPLPEWAIKGDLMMGMRMETRICGSAGGTGAPQC